MDVGVVAEREWQQLLAAGWWDTPAEPPVDLADDEPPCVLPWPSCLPKDPFDVDSFDVEPSGVDPFDADPSAANPPVGAVGATAGLPGPDGLPASDVLPDPDALVGRLCAGASELPESLVRQVGAAGAQELVGWVRQLEQVAAWLAAADEVLVAELDRRGTALDLGYPTTARFLTGHLRVRPGVATARVSAAWRMGPRSSLTGQPLPPQREQVAAAQQAGVISSDHARVIDQALTQLPGSVSVPDVERVEAILVELATRTDPGVVARAGRHALAVLDPDGAAPREDDLDRHRGLVITGTDAGVGRINGTLTPQLLAALQAVLSPLAAPRPADDAVVDTRTPAQRLHDALADACARLLRSATLPQSGGVAATVIVTMTEAQLHTRTGLATTTFGTTLPIDRLLQYATECDYVPVVLNDAGGVLAYGRTRRIATPGQTTALIARGKGCSMPGCQTPSQWCERHHIIAHADGGPTDLENLTLVCGFHHRSFRKHGWECVMLNDRPHWKPPPHLDPHRTPQRNNYWDTIDFTHRC